MTWEDEFDKEFPTVEVNSLAEFASAAEILQTYPSRIKSFIRTQKSQSVQETLDAVRAGLPKQLEANHFEAKGINYTLDRVHELLLFLTPSKE